MTLSPRDVVDLAEAYGVVKFLKKTDAEIAAAFDELQQRVKSEDPQAIWLLNIKPQVRAAFLMTNGYVHSLDMDGASLWRLFEQTPRVKLPDNAAIVTCATPEFWPLLQILAISLELSHDVQRFCISLGLSNGQEAWLSRHGVQVLDEPIDLIIPKAVDHWTCWNRPLFVREVSKYADDILWIDADAFVMRSLTPIFERLKSQPVFTPDQIARARVPDRWRRHLANKEYLYTLMPVKRRIKGDLWINNGVTAMRFPRDGELLDAWTEITFAARNPKIRHLIHCWDQGCVSWAVEKLGLTYCITDRCDWNDAITMRAVSSLSEVAKRERKAIMSSVVHHHAGNEKPMLANPKEQIAEPIESHLSLKMFVLGHKPEQFDGIAKKHYLEFVRLDHLNVGCWQHNQMAESRFFFSDLLERTTEDYLGCGSASWSNKYYSHLDQLWHLDLQPNVVWAACVAKPGWAEKHHKELPHSEWLTQKLMCIAGLEGDVNRATSVWSNNFIMSRKLTLEYVAFFRRVFGEFYRRHFPICGWDDLPLDVGRWDKGRRWAYAAERLSLIWFASRSDIEIRQI